MLSCNDYSGKNFIVTGASSGIGASVCRKLSELGANVALIARNKDKLNKVLLSLHNQNNHRVFAYDLCKVDGIIDIVGEIYSAFNKIDGLAYCAGTNIRVRFRDLTPDVIQSVMSVNFYAFVELIRAISNIKKKNDYCSVVSISSLASNTQEKYFLSYASSKASMEVTIKILSNELRKKNISLCSIKPGFVDTPFIASMNDLYDDFNLKLVSENTQNQGLIPVGVIAEYVCGLLGPNGKYFSGGNVVMPAGANY